MTEKTFILPGEVNESGELTVLDAETHQANREKLIELNTDAMAEIIKLDSFDELDGLHIILQSENADAKYSYERRKLHQQMTSLFVIDILNEENWILRRYMEENNTDLGTEKAMVRSILEILFDRILYGAQSSERSMERICRLSDGTEYPYFSGPSSAYFVFDSDIDTAGATEEERKDLWQKFDAYSVFDRGYCFGVYIPYQIARKVLPSYIYDLDEFQSYYRENFEYPSRGVQSLPIEITLRYILKDYYSTVVRFYKGKRKGIHSLTLGLG